MFDNMLDFIDILKRNPACEEGTCVKNYFRKHPCNAPIEWVRRKRGLTEKFLTRVTDEQEKVSFAYI